MDENTASPGKSNNNMLIVGGVVALVVIVGGAVLLMGSNSESSSTPVPQVTATTQASDKKTASPSAAMEIDPNTKTFTIEAGSFYYKPNEIRVKKGDTVKVVMNSVSMMHDFNIDSLGVKIPVTKSGEKAEVTFVAEKVGSFEFYCSVGSHRQQGQVGTLIVE